MSFTEEFKKLRDAIGTQKEVSELLGVHVNTVSGFEIGKRIPGSSKQRAHLEVMSEALLEISQAELMRKRRLNGII